MAQYAITYSCGHSGTVNLAGPVKGREAKLDWYRTAVCPECYRAQKVSDASAASEGLTELTGTEKQIRWAIQIRADFVARMRDIISRIPEAGDQEKALAAFLAAVNEMAETKWWIEHRSNLRGALNPLYMQKLGGENNED
jgi:hypothetical protein